MKITALVTWVVSAFAGIYLLSIWLANGGMRQQATKVTRFPSALVFGHPFIAMAGLFTWVMYIATTHPVYAWGAFIALVVAAMMGFTMLTRWLVGRGGRHARGAEQTFPVVAVTVHGLVGTVTFVLVFLTAIAVSGR